MTEKLDLEILIKIGKFTNKLKKKVRANCESFKYSKLSEIVEEIEGAIFSAGYIPAFPCAISINNVAAHYTFFDTDYEFEIGDVIKVDFGVSSSGFCTDCAFTFEYKSSEYKELLAANERALNKQLEHINIGTTVASLGAIAEEEAEGSGFGTIHELSGHQIGKNNLHCGTSIPNYDNNSESTVGENMEFAIEPYFTTGGPRIKEAFDSNILHLKNTKNTRDPMARKILQYVKENYSHLPFSKRWLVKELMENTYKETTASFSKNQVERAIATLKRDGIIYEYPALVSRDGSINSQFEETAVFIDGKKVIITRLE